RLVCCCLSLLFQLHPIHRALPSFPTRRSSDLPIGEHKRKGRNNSRTAERGDVGSPWAIGSKYGGHTAVHPELGTIEDFELLVRRDRKSTRLNSSHVKISYAVFCLKKKKEPAEP